MFKHSAFFCFLLSGILMASDQTSKDPLHTAALGLFDKTLNSYIKAREFILTTQKSEKIIGDITKKELRNFIIGAHVGVLHGLINRAIEHFFPKFSKYLSYTLTHFYLAEILQYSLCSDDDKFSARWGHGIAQAITESVNHNKTTLFRPKINVNLIIAFLFYLSSLAKESKEGNKQRFIF
jgi:hypothetical protein